MLLGALARPLAASEPLASAPPPEAYRWELPRGMPQPPVPPDNPMSQGKVELGRRLFYDVRLSSSGAYACASCHQQARAFTDGLARAVGATGELHPRSAMSLANVAYNTRFGWEDPETASLEAQAAIPMQSERPVELGLRGNEERVLAALRRDRFYAAGFAREFPSVRASFDLSHIRKAIAAFERTLISGRSAYDRAVYGDELAALSPAARRGLALFGSAALGCAECHGGPAFAGREPEFHGTGLYSLDGAGLYPADGQGLFARTRRPADMGRFRAPGLRNIALTAPYMHDGSVASLGDVLAHYARGGRNWATPAGPAHAERGAQQSERVRGFALSDADAGALIAFLESLTDEAFVGDPRFADPRQSDGKRGCEPSLAPAPAGVSSRSDDDSD